MAMGPERSKPLHNFTMPRDLRWGNQRFLRCIKLNSNARISPIHRFAADSDQRKRGDSVRQPRAARRAEAEADAFSGSQRVNPAPPPPPPPPPPSDGCRRFSGVDDGIAAMREKVMLDIQRAADKMKYAIFKDGLREGEVPFSPALPPPAASVEGESQRPWNLRSRRATCRTPASRFTSFRNGAAGRGLTVVLPESDTILPHKKAGLAAPAEKSPKLTSGPDGVAAAGDTTARPKFSVALSKSDIEEDYFVMVGHRPPRRPKKRAKIVQRELDTLFPGLWLTEVTADLYKVSEVAP